jgi:phosphatidylglycerophosphate synthase
MLAARYKPFFNRLLEPWARLLLRAGLSPNTVTLATPLLASLLCLWFVRTGETAAFCLGMAAVGCLDGLDGAMARLGGRATKFGAYLDAVCDRYVEGMVALAAAAVTGYWALSLTVLAGALLVSYAKARAAMEVPVSNQEWPDLMERTERSLLFLVGLAAGRLLPWRPLGRDLFWWTLLLLSILIHATVIQRVLRARRLIQARG